MDTKTGEIRSLAEGEQPAETEIELTEEQADFLKKLPLSSRLHYAARIPGETAEQHRARKNKLKANRKKNRK